MKCLTLDECQRWFSSIGVSIVQNRDLHFEGTQKKHTLFAKFPTDASRLIYFAGQLVDWLPTGRPRMLWLKDWKNYPAGHAIIFEKLRRGAGEIRHLIDAPGHLFEWNEQKTYQPLTSNLDEIEDHALMVGFVLLILCLGWDAYLLSDHHHIFLSDERVLFSSPLMEKINAAEKMMESFSATTIRRTG